MARQRVIVFEDHGWLRLLPLVYSRGVFQLRCGMGELLQRIQRLTAAYLTEVWCRPSLAEVVGEQTGLGVNQKSITKTLFLNGRGIWHHLPESHPEGTPWVGVVGPHRQVACIHADERLSATLSAGTLLDEAQTTSCLTGLAVRDVSDCVTLIDWPWELVLANSKTLIADWEKRSGDRDHSNICDRHPAGVSLLNPEGIHLGLRSRIKPCVVIDAEDGPVWIGDDVTILPHTYVQGPAFIGDGCLVQPGSVIRDGTTIGPCSKIGGEIQASIIQGYSNKQHDGFLGHSYIGSWVNLAADCINSDLKNTYGDVRVPINGVDVETGEMFVGMFAGDHSKMGINVSFPTGTVIGFASSVFATRSPKFVPSFAWVEDTASQVYDSDRGLKLAQRVMQRRNRTMTTAEQQLFLSVNDLARTLESR